MEKNRTVSISSFSSFTELDNTSPHPGQSVTSDCPPSGHILLPEIDENYPEIGLSVNREPLVKPSATSLRILVSGGGVSGLMTAWVLLDRGYRVTILAKEWAWTSDWQSSRLTSQIAGALGEYPPGGCGLTETESPGPGWANIDHYREWALESYEFYKKLTSILDGRLKPAFGVVMTRLNQFFYHDLETVNELNKDDIAKLEAIRKAEKDSRIDDVTVHDVHGLQDIFDDLNVDQQWRAKLKACYTHQAPIINTDKAMTFLMAHIKRKGGELETREIKEELILCADKLAAMYDAAAIINATGLGAKLLARDDDVYPNLNQAYLIPAQTGHDKQSTKVVFIVPRNDETLIVGSIFQPENDCLNLKDGSPEVKIMWERARDFLPTLNDAHAVPWYPLAQGLRPFTKKNVKVRAEKVSQTTVIHNYGHGGSGWTLAVGCARSAVFLLELTMKGETAEQANERLYPRSQ